MWLIAALDDLGYPDKPRIETLQVRPWSAIYRVRVGSEAFILKACSPELRHEVWVSELLGEEWEEAAPEVLASAQDMGWLLLPEYGRRLREGRGARERLRVWAELLPRYGQMQFQMAGQRQRLLSAGVVDRTTTSLSGQMGSLLESLVRQGVVASGLLGAEELEQMRSLRAKVSATCASLAGIGIEDSLNHGDLHDGNVFVDCPGTRVLDWGDCSVTHPFFSLRTTFVSIENSAGLDEDDPVFDSLRDSYLEPWTSHYSRADLSGAFALARRLWSLPSALSWHRALSPLELAEQGELAAAVPQLLQELGRSLGNSTGVAQGNENQEE